MVAAIFFRPQIIFMNNDMIMLWTPTSNLVMIGWTVQKLQILFKIQDGGSRHLASYNNHFDIVGKGVRDFLIAFNVNSVDILHSFLTNRRNVVKIPVLTLPPPIHPKF